jgi:phage tail sheath protein FI
MPEYLSPGVYVEEIDTGSKPIEGVSTSTAGVIGVAERGPVNWPMLVTSFGEYTRLFGEYLPSTVFSNTHGAHHYLPHAVEGFFNNGGKRLYVTRVLDTAGARAARFQLHDRGSLTSGFTMLLRGAQETTGTLASGNPLYVVNLASLTTGAPLAAGQTIRLDDGSASEYFTVNNVGAAAGLQNAVVLDFPLFRSHVPPAAAALESFNRNVLNGAAIALTANVARNAATVSISGVAADIQAIVVGSLLEFAGTGVGNQVLEYRFVRTVIPISGISSRLTFDAPLAMDHPSASTAVNNLSLQPADIVTPAVLDRAANAGDRSASLTVANPFAAGDLLAFNRTDPNNREVRRAGNLAAFQIAGSTAEATPGSNTYPAGSLIEVFTLTDDGRQVTGLPGASQATLNDVVVIGGISLLAPGVRIQLDVGAPMETLIVQSVNIATGDVTFTTPLGAHVAPFPAVPEFMMKRLTADAQAGSSVLALNNRQTLNVDDILRIGDAPTEEYGVIAAIPNRAASVLDPDPGIVVLTTPLTQARLGPAGATPGENARRQGVAALNPAKAPGVVEFDMAGGETLMVASEGAGAYVAGDHIRVTPPSGVASFHRVASAVAALAPQPATVTAPLQARHGAGSAIHERRPLIDVEALDMGEWGDRLRLSIQDEPQGLVSRTTLTFNAPPTQIRLASAAGVESGTILELIDGAGNPVLGLLKVEFVDRAANYLIHLALPGLQAQHLAAIAASLTPLPVRSREFQLTVRLLHQPDTARPPRDEIVIGSETFRNLSMDPRHSRYIQKVIGLIGGLPLRLEDHRPEGESNYIRVRDLGTPAELLQPRLGPEPLIDILPSGQERPARHPLSGGSDSVATMDDVIYVGADNAQPELRTGLFSFQNIDDISLVAAPGRVSPVMQGALIDHCELMRYRFAVLDGPPPPNDSLNSVQFQRQQFDTKYAAIYYPWMLIPEPFPLNANDVPDFPIPPSGHMLGIYARTDIDRGVHKAPANEVVRGVLGLQRIVNKGEQDILNPYPVNINVIRDFRHNNRGIRVWGGRVITSDSDFKYVNVRRLLIFVEKSIDLGLQWVVFEPNAEPLWARVVRSISNFLTVVWRNGALEGTKREEAFFVKCDRTTMTQTDIDSGRLIVVIGVAAVKPAEFVIVRIGLWTAHSDE